MCEKWDVASSTRRKRSDNDIIFSCEFMALLCFKARATRQIIVAISTPTPSRISSADQEIPLSERGCAAGGRAAGIVCGHCRSQGKRNCSAGQGACNAPHFLNLGLMDYCLQDQELAAKTGAMAVEARAGARVAAAEARVPQSFQSNTANCRRASV